MIPERIVPGTAEWELLEEEHRQRYEFFAPHCKGLRILDLACGTGYGSRLLAQLGAASVTGVDISAEALECARTHFAHPAVEFVQCDAANIRTLGKQFDAAVSFETIEHLANPEMLLREVHGLLRPGAFFVCSTPNRDFERKSSTPNPYHLCEWSYAEFDSAFARYFEIEGRFHQSPSPAYVRHLQLLSELEGIQKKMRFSVAFRIEEKLRRALGKEALNGHHLAQSLWKITPGDYVIEPITQPSPRHGVFLMAGRTKASA